MPPRLYFIIIHHTHYEKSDWSRALNQITIACELDMINAISAADGARCCIHHVKFQVRLITEPLEVFSSAKEWPNASPLFMEREIENFVEDKNANNTKRSAKVARQVF